MKPSAFDESLIRSDFASFADPATTVSLSNRSLTWTQDRQLRTAVLLPQQNRLPDIQFETRVYSYHEFFASEHMADLRALSANMAAVLLQSPAYTGDAYVDSEVTDEDTNARMPASQCLLSMIDGHYPTNKTQLCFLRGRAGDGKSALLVEVSIARARSYGEGNANNLLFYVNAQGSALARIDEVLAKVSQDFRTKFTYHAIATLTRLSLLIPIIDGFDELLGPGGYKDAFSSLALFVSRLAGGGTLIASARSTFYQYTTFGEQAARFASDDIPLHFQIRPLVLQPWNDRNAAEYLAKKSSDLKIDQLRETFGARSDEILTSPFLVTRLVSLRISAAEIGEGKHVIRRIVEELVRREMVDKVLDPQGKPLLTLDQHMAFVGGLAEEMWWQETRDLDEQTVQTIAELLCEEFSLSPDVGTRFVQKVPSYALLTRSDGPPRVGFRHEFYFAFFLGTNLARRLLRYEDVSDFLARSSFSTVIAEETAIAVAMSEPVAWPRLVELINARRNIAIQTDVSNANAGTLLWAFLVNSPGSLNGLSLSRAAFSGLEFRQSGLRDLVFQQCLFNQCDLSGVTWENVLFESCRLVNVTVSSQTRLQSRGITLRGGEVVGLRVKRQGDGWRELYALNEIADALRDLGTQVVEGYVPVRTASTKSSSLVGKLGRLLKVPERTLYFSEEDFQVLGMSLSGDLREVFSLLRNHGLLVEVERQRKGRRRMYRLTESAAAIRQGESGVYASRAIEALWVEIFAP